MKLKKDIYARWNAIVKKLNVFFFIICFAVGLFSGAIFEVFSPLTVQTASAQENAYLKCHAYQVEMTVNTDRTINVQERIEIEFLQERDAYGNRLTMFYKSLPKDSIYTDVSASCAGNEDFYFYVDDNPDMDEFIDVCCVGGVQRGARWAYDISYTMELGGDDVENGMRLDVVGTGSPFALNNVTVVMNFPEKPAECIRYTGEYGNSGQENVLSDFSKDGKTLVIQEEKLALVYNGEFGEYTAQGITLEFVFDDGVLDSFSSTRIWTERTWVVLLFGGFALVGAIGLFVVGKKRGEIVSVVNIKPPEGVDPMRMGFLIDGRVNDEDVTSMIYYFASKGYLTIDFSNEENPVLIRSRNAGSYVELPQDAPIYQKTLFEGLFRGGRERTEVSALENVYYQSVDAAKLQVVMKKMPRYDKKSVGCFLGTMLIIALACFLAPLTVGSIYVGGGYTSPSGVCASVFFAVSALLLWTFKDLEFKGKARKGVLVALLAVYLIMTIAFGLIFAKHLLTGWEKIYLILICTVAQIFGYRTLSRTESYNKTLGDILGFKDFIVVTEEDKIKYMLQENPELYYDVLPYAQVLGVTDEWEEKFSALLLEPPKWATGYHYSVFDYLIISRCMRSMSRSMVSRPQSSGTSVGRSGGGGFGGFSGGGRGGGGFGAR